MAAVQPRIHPPSLRCRHRIFYSSSSASPPTPPPADSADSQSPPSAGPQLPPQSPLKVNISSYFSDIKSKLKSQPLPPRRADEIRKNLANFSMRPLQSQQNPPNQSSIRFSDIFMKNSGGADRTGSGDSRFSLDSIRGSLKNLNPSGDRVVSPFSPRPNQESVRPAAGLSAAIFSREEEVKDKKDALKLGFSRSYSYEELGEKLRQLKVEAAKDGKEMEEFSLQDLGQLLVKFQETEASALSGNFYREFRDSLLNVMQNEKTKKSGVQNTSLLRILDKKATPAYMLMPPQEQLAERYFHPDHMSAAEKMKLELKRVRDEFKMSESDCGSARVQVAQLTTKIKYLSAVLAKKDKHSRKGLQEMVQQRKKLLKYLRRTDWESYCFILSKFGLRDTPEYKAPDYESMRKGPQKKKKKKQKA